VCDQLCQPRLCIVCRQATQPAACLFYRSEKAATENGDEPIITVAPFVAEQTAKPAQQAGVNSLTLGTFSCGPQDWREIDRKEAQKGERSDVEAGDVGK